MKLKLVIAYALFACMATAANILAQYIMILIYGGQYSLLLSIVVGTLLGLYLKFILDKKYIFNNTSDSIRKHGQLFFLYSVMGVFTTALYLAVEVSFDYFYNSLLMRYIGAALGLSIGYCVKYQLDKKYVFKAEPTIQRESV